MKSEKILWLAHEANRSGANICLQEFMQMGSERHIEQYLVVPHTGNMQTDAESKNIPTSVVHFYGWMSSIGAPRFDRKSIRRGLRNSIAIVQLCQLIIREKITVVFSNTSTINVGAWAAKLTGRKHYWYVHEMGEEDFNVALPNGWKSFRFMNNFSERLFANTVHLLKKYEKSYEGIKMSVLRYHVDVRNEVMSEPKKGMRIQLLMLGQITESKGQHLAIEAVHILKGKGFLVQLNIKGSADDLNFLDRLHKTISEFSLENEVKFKPFSDSPESSILANDILLMCSKCEAYGRVTVEAMKLGVPVIGANTCGTAEIIEDKKSGLLFDSGNALSLAITIEQLIEDENLRREVVAGGKRRASEISGTKDFNDFLDSILN